MIDPGVGPALVEGGVLGLCYFGLLWAAVRKVPTGPRPALLALASFPARAALLAVGLLLVMDGSQARLVAGLAGLLLARTYVVHRVRRGTVPEGGSTPWS